MSDPTTAATQPSPLADALGEPIEVGEPDVSGPLAVFPLFGPKPLLDYDPFSRVHDRVHIGELEGGASVNDLTVENPTDRNVLLLEGEELLGAQQNRVLDVSILIGAASKTVIPVSCVEAGRWDGSRRRERFRPSRQAADPEIRRSKHRQARASARLGMEARPSQSAVWEQVATRGAELAAIGPTSAMSDIYASRRDELAELRQPIRRHENQCGAVCAIGGRISILDYVSRPDAWADLHDAIVEGYALDALRATRSVESPPAPPRASVVRGFTLLACEQPAESTSRGPGIGSTVRFAGAGAAGSGLIVAGEDGSGELVQMTAYLDDDESEPEGRPPRRPGRRANIARPSRRRRTR